MITEPKIVFLDEPTLGLDVRARRDLWKIIKELKGEVTINLTTHYLEEVNALDDRIAIIRNRIETLRGMQIRELIPRKQSKRPRSEEVLIRTLKSRIKALEDENKQLKDQVQKLYGKLF